MNPERSADAGRTEAISPCIGTAHPCDWVRRFLAVAAPHGSSRSSGDGACVEIAVVGDGVAVRDTKNRDAGHLEFTRDEWRAFIGGAKDGEFDI